MTLSGRLRRNTDKRGTSHKRDEELYPRKRQNKAVSS